MPLARSPRLSLYAGVVFALLVGLAPPLWAQGVPTGHALTQAVLDVWGRTAGLPQLTVSTLAQTSDGALWVGTQEGLARFDGLAFETFDAAHGDLPSASVSALHAAADGTLWIATRGGVARYRNGAFQTPGGALAGAAVLSFAEGDDGTVWAGAANGVVARFDGTEFRALAALDSLRDQTVTALAQRDGTLWIGTKADGLWSLADGRLARVESELTRGHITALLATPGGVWIGTESGGLLRYASERVRAVTRAGVTTVRALHRDPAGSLWVGTEGGGLVRYANGKASSLDEAQGLPHATVRSLLTDREGSLWVGTEGGGLARLRPGKFVPWGTPEGLQSDIVFSVVETDDGVVWFGTEGGGLSRLQSGRVTSVEGLPGDIVLALAPAAGSGVWVGLKDEGLALVQGDQVTTVEGLPTRSVYGLYTDPDGTLWGATSAGLVRLSRGALTLFTEADGLSDNEVTAIARDARGRLLVGTYEGGLNVLDVGGNGPIRSARALGVEDGLGSEAVISLSVGAGGVTWIGTEGGGLTRLTAGGAVHTLRARDGLPSETILHPLEDGRGGLWVSTNRGLAVLSLAEIEAHSDGAAELRVVVYEEDSGLRSREFNGGVQPAGWRGRDGTLWFASAGGAVAVEPGSLPTNAVPPTVAVRHLRADGDPVSLRGEVRLEPGTRRLAIHYTALSFINSPALRFRYRLSGVDADWVEAGTVREADYTNLDPGRYVFEVQAANVDGVWSKVPATLSFTLAPFFTQTTWFKALLFIGGLVLLVGAYLYRVRSLTARQRELEHVVAERTRALREEKENVETERMRAEAAKMRSESAWARAEGTKAIIEAQANELVETNDALRDVNARLAETSEVKSHLMRVVAHDLTNPLGVILGYTDVLRDVVDEGEAGEMVGSIESAASDMLALVQRFLGAEAIDDGRLALHTRPLDLAGLVATSAERFRGPAVRKDQTLTVDLAEGAWIMADQDWLKEVVDNLLSNAVKYTPRGRRIWVSVTHAAEDRVQLRVRDEGPGLTDEDKAHLFGRFQRLSARPTGDESSTGLGLSIVKKIVEMHDGRVWAESVLGEGTTFAAEFDAHVERVGAEAADLTTA